MHTRKTGITFYDNREIDRAKQVVVALQLQAGDVIDIMRLDEELLIYRKYRSTDTDNAHRNVCHATHRYIHHAGTLRVWSKAIPSLFLNGENKRACPVGAPVMTHLGLAMPIICTRPINR